MRNISINKVTSLLLGAAIVFGNAPARAFFGVGDVVTDPGLTAKTIAEGAARAAEAARQLQMEINQYQTMIQNTLSLGDPIFKPIGDSMRALSSVYWQGQSLMYRAQNLDSQFNIMYPNYQSYMYTMGNGAPTFSERYRAWSDKNNEGIRDSLKVSGMVIEQGESADAMLQRIAAQSATAGGQKQAIQAGNQIAAMQVQELLKLQVMVEAQLKMQANYLALENERRGMDDAARAQWRKVPVTGSQTRGF